MTYEQMHEILDELVDELPPGIFDRLNGGVILSHEEKLHPKSVGHDLYVSGEYVVDSRGLGRYIILYYGSLVRSIQGLPFERQVERIKKVLYHELTHHVEHLAGDYSLDRQDAQEIAGYLRRYEEQG